MNDSIVLERLPATAAARPAATVSQPKRQRVFIFLTRYGLIFSVNLGWLPVARRGGWEHYILPSVTLGWLFASSFLRLTRSAMLEVLDSEFIKFARAKGVDNNVVIWKHAFRNALLPSLTYAGLLLAGLITGAVITETIFSWPGLGSLAVTSVLQLDFPVLTAVVFVITLAYAGMALFIDLLYAVADPRIRLE